MPRYMTVALTDGSEIEVRILGLFELDDVIIPLKTGPYTISIMIGGKPYRQAFDIKAFDKPPKVPKVKLEEVEERSQAWYDWQTYIQYQEALVFEQECRLDALRYFADIRDYIMKMCIDPSVKNDIVNPIDWERVSLAALVPELTLQDLIATVSRTHKATFDDENVLVAVLQNAMMNNDDEDTSVAIPKLWELETINALQLTEAAYGELSIAERARKVVTLKLSDWLAALQMEKKNAHSPVQFEQTPT